jgi:beta-lactam-binding protein with PASTA domain
VSRVFSASVAAGRVLRQTPRAGARLVARGKVNLVVSRGRRP